MWSGKKKTQTKKQPNLFFTGQFGKKNIEKQSPEASSSVIFRIPSGSFSVEIAATLCEHVYK